MNEPCAHCDGSGESPWDDATGRCALCAGYGAVAPATPDEDDE